MAFNLATSSNNLGWNTFGSNSFFQSTFGQNTQSNPQWVYSSESKVCKIQEKIISKKINSKSKAG